MALTELPSTAPESLGPDKIDQRVYAGEPYRIQAFLVNKIRQYLIDIGSEVGLHDGSTVGSLVARVIALEAGGGGGGTNAQSIWTRPIYNGVAPTNGQVIAYDSANARWNYQTVATLTGQLGQTSSLPDVRGIRETSGPSLLTFGAIADGQTLVRSGSTVVGVPSAVPTSFYFLPGAVSPPTGAYTSWSALMAAIGTLRLVLPTAKVTVTVDGSAVGGVVDVPSGTYDWTNIEFVGAAFETLNFKAGASVTQFNQVTFRYLQLQTDATAGSPAFVTSAVYTWSIYFYAAAAFDLGAGYIPLFRSASGTGGLFLHFYDGGCLYQSGGTASAVADATGGTLYVNIYDSGYVESRTIASTNPASAAWFSLLSPAAMDAGASNWLDSHPLWTSGTITTTISSAAKYVRFTPTGTVAATTVQAAIAEVDSEKAAVSGGQIGGTGAAPDVRGIRETAGPTLLTFGAIADGQSLVRNGTSIVGAAQVATGPYQLLWKWNGVDLTEFDQVGDGSHTYAVTTWGARNSNDDPTPAIRMDSPATSGGFSALLVKANLLPAFTDPTKLLIVARMQNVTTLGSQDPLLIPYYESTTYFTALARKTTGTSPPEYLWCLREGSTTYTDKTSVSFPSPLANNVDGAFFSAEILLSPASGSQKPWIAVQQNRFFPQTFAQTILQARASYAAGWTGLGSYAPRIGFGVRTYGTAAASGNCIADIALYKVT